MIRFFIGCAPNHDDVESQAVLEWSIRKHSSEPVEINWMFLSPDPESPFHGWNTRMWATPFTGFRWAVPELAGHEGKAIYCDSDFIFLADPAELWNQEIPKGKVVLGKGENHWRLCLSMWDCAAAKNYIPPISEMKKNAGICVEMRQLFGNRSSLVHPFQGDWNNLDGRDGGPLHKVKALHYTCMSTQPQLKYAKARLAKVGRKHWFPRTTQPHPIKEIQKMFDDLLVEAADNGYTIDRYMEHPPLCETQRLPFNQGVI